MDCYDSDAVDSDQEIYLYSQIHHHFNSSTKEETSFIPGGSASIETPNQQKTIAPSGSISEDVRKYHILSRFKLDRRNNRYEETKKPSMKITINNQTPQRTVTTDPKPLSSSSKNSEDRIVCSEPFKPVIEVLFDTELSPEKKNRTKPANQVIKQLPLSAKPLKSKQELQSSDDDSIYLISSEDQADVVKPVLNVSSAESCEIVDEVVFQKYDSSLWQVNIEDQPEAKESRGKNRLAHIACHNCKEKGHLARSCTRPKRINNCFLCGQPGHSGTWCLNPICSQCLSPGHTKEVCTWSPHWCPKCRLCNTAGHLWQECPSIWRRYHLTTKPGQPMQSSESLPSREPKYCYNCGLQGHFGYVCKDKRMDAAIVPTNRRLDNCSDPDLEPVRDKKLLKLWKQKCKTVAKLERDFILTTEGCNESTQKRSFTTSLGSKRKRFESIMAETTFPRWKLNKPKKQMFEESNTSNNTFNHGFQNLFKKGVKRLKHSNEERRSFVQTKASGSLTRKQRKKLRRKTNSLDRFSNRVNVMHY